MKYIEKVSREVDFMAFLKSPLAPLYFLLAGRAIDGLITELQEIGLVGNPRFSYLFEAMVAIALCWSVVAVALVVRRSGLLNLSTWSFWLAMYWGLYTAQTAIWGGFEPGHLLALFFFLLTTQERNSLSVVLMWTKTFLRLFVASSFLVGVVVGLSGGAGVKHGLDLFNLEIGFRGITSHPNLFAGTVAVGLLLEVAVPQRKSSWFWGFMFLVAGLLTYSFGAGAALAAALFVVGVGWLRETDHRRRGVFFVSSLVGAGLFGLLAMGLNGRLNSLGSFTTGRTHIWLTLTGENTNLLMFGTGLSRLSEIAHGANAHNDVLQALAVSGIAGVVMLLGSIYLRFFDHGEVSSSKSILTWALLAFLIVFGLVEIPLAPSFSPLLLTVLLVFGLPRQTAVKSTGGTAGNSAKA